MFAFRIAILGNLASLIRVGDMNDKILAIILAALLPGLSYAQAPQNYQCSLGDLQRRVEIFYETGVTVPCEVHYFKDTEAPGETQVLWRALREAGYCERMAERLIGKLQDLGWSCGQGGDGGEAAVSEPDSESADSDDADESTLAEDSETTEE